MTRITPPSPAPRRRRRIARRAVVKRMRDLIGAGTQRAFAHRIGVPPQAVTKYLHGTLPDHEVLLRIVRAYHISIEWLLTGHAPRRRTDGPDVIEGEARVRAVGHRIPAEPPPLTCPYCHAPLRVHLGTIPVRFRPLVHTQLRLHQAVLAALRARRGPRRSVSSQIAGLLHRALRNPDLPSAVQLLPDGQRIGVTITIPAGLTRQITRKFGVRPAMVVERMVAAQSSSLSGTP